MRAERIVMTPTEELPDSGQPKPSRRVRAVLSDALAFVRAAEANKAIAAVTIEQLIGDHIKRIGDTKSSASSRYNPYSYDPNDPPPAGKEPEGRANFIGGSDLGRPTKLDIILALKNEIDAVVDEIKGVEPSAVADAEEYEDGVADYTAIESEELG